MKNILKLIIVSVMLFAINSCKTSNFSDSIITYKDSTIITTASRMTINITDGKSFNHPTYVIWQEDMKGNYQKTIFITKSYASGIFGHQMKNDSVWINRRGTSYQPAALPYWTHRKGLIKGKFLIPDPKHPFVDAISGATPISNSVIETNYNSKSLPYRILLEVNQTWDWNNYWNNNKFPQNTAYKHSSQPSVIYAVTINKNDSVYYMNPIGHGSPTGENGKLYTDLSTLTTAKNIFKTIKITLKK